MCIVLTRKCVFHGACDFALTIRKIGVSISAASHGHELGEFSVEGA